jgi:hypothetical protein
VKVRLLARMNLRASRRVWLALLATLVVGTACASASETASPGGRADGSAAVRNLSSIGALQDQFDRDTGSTRLILLISPT